MTDIFDETDDDLIDPAEPSPKIWLYPFLADLGITRIEAYMSGCGDSGEINDVTYYRGEETAPNEEVESVLDALTLDDGSASQVTFKDALYMIFETDGSAAGNWYDNEGGSVSCSYDLEPVRGRIRLIEADYTPGEEYGDEEENDDWEPDFGATDEEGEDDDIEP
jgi:hypothetical protein